MNLKKSGFNSLVFNSRSRGEVELNVYLPPDWTPGCAHDYPLIVFLHGKGGDSFTFEKYIKAEILNSCIESNKLEEYVIVCPRGSQIKDDVQWMKNENEDLICSLNSELIYFCNDKLSAGKTYLNRSLFGHSRGAAGALYLSFKYPEVYSSVSAIGYVSDYTLESIEEQLELNLSEIKEKGKSLIIQIGSEDSFVRNKNRFCAQELHEKLNLLGVDHYYENMFGVEHGLDSFWYSFNQENEENGPWHLKVHRLYKSLFK